MPFLEIGDEKIEYEIRRHARARRLKLAVKADASVALTVPRRISMAFAERFLADNASWVMERYVIAKRRIDEALVVRPSGGYSRHKAAARKLILERLSYFKDLYSIEHGRVAIRNQKTRWGSCSAKGNLNFNYKLVHLPLDLVDYVVVHELCHIKELNHSEKFWRLVDFAVPDYKVRRKKLKEVGLF